MAVDVLSPACRFLTVAEIQHKFKLSAAQARTFLKLLGVPLLRYQVEIEEPLGPASIGRKAVVPYRCPTREMVLAPAFEAALFANMMPGGPGIEVPDPNLPPVVDSLPEAAYTLSGAFRVLDYWDLFKRNPQAIHLVIALCHLMYGPISEKALKDRLWLLGDLLLADITRHRHAASDKVKKEQADFAQERRDDVVMYGDDQYEPLPGDHSD